MSNYSSLACSLHCGPWFFSFKTLSRTQSLHKNFPVNNNFSSNVSNSTTSVCVVGLKSDYIPICMTMFYMVCNYPKVYPGLMLDLKFPDSYVSFFYFSWDPIQCYEQQSYPSSFLSPLVFLWCFFLRRM